MKKLLYSFLTILFVSILACNNAGNDSAKMKTPQQVLADSLEKEVDNGHNTAMPKSMKIPNIQKEIKQLLDSISKLPAKAKESAAPYKAKLETLQNELEYAYMAMDKWMVEYKYDSAMNDLDKRIKYLTEEKLKVDKVKEAVLGSIAKADSLLKAKL